MALVWLIIHFITAFSISTAWVTLLYIYGRLRL